MINKITPSVDNNYWLGGLSTNKGFFKRKIPSGSKPTNARSVSKTLGTSVIQSLHSPWNIAVPGLILNPAPMLCSLIYGLIRFPLWWGFLEAYLGAV